VPQATTAWKVRRHLISTVVLLFGAFRGRGGLAARRFQHTQH